MELNNYEIGRAVRKLREEKGLSIYDLSIELDMSMSALYQLEEGFRNISYRTIDKLMKYYDADPNSILGIYEKDNLNYTSVDRKLNQFTDDTRKYLNQLFNNILDHEMQSGTQK